MSNYPQMRVGDIGSTIRLIVRDASGLVDLSGASTKQIKLKKPSGEVLVKTAVFTTNGVDGAIEYVTVADDLDESGPWMGQGYIVTPAKTYHTTEFQFPIAENLS